MPLDPPALSTPTTAPDPLPPQAPPPRTPDHETVWRHTFLAQFANLAVEALSFQQSIPPVYQRVYPEPGMVTPRLQRELNAFLRTWLRNLKAQGHRLVRDTD